MTPPNILFITWHDAGRWFGCYGNSHTRTPNADALAAGGCRFANTFSACAICSPSRAAMMTGRYCQDNGVMFLTNTVNNNRLHRDERHLARRLKEEHGYRTALFGIQHECAHEHVAEIMAVDERFATDPWRSCDVAAGHLCRWLRKRSGDSAPFYAQIGFIEAHLNQFYSGKPSEIYPWAKDDANGLFIPPYLKDTPRARETISVLQGLIRRGDEAIGQILEALRDSGREKDTMVVMCVDHGAGLPRAKTWCYDPGTAVAWIIRYPGAVPGGTVVENMTAHVDVLPTVLELAGLPVPGNIQGRSFAAHARGQSREELRREAFSHMVENIRALRSHRYKIIRNFRRPSAKKNFYGGIELADKAEHPAAAAPHTELYDLKKDPDEFRNLADDPAYADTKRELDARLWNFLLDHNDFLVNEPARDEWQAQTRRDLEAHCAAAGRACPVTAS